MRVILCDAGSNVRSELVKSGIAYLLGRGGVYRKLIDAIRASTAAYPAQEKT